MQAPFESERLEHSLELYELHYQLTLIQHYRSVGVPDPGNTNQVEVIASPGGGLYKLGNMVANDWDLVDPLQNNKIVAHARGLHIQASRGEEQCWHTSFDIVFEEGSGT
nr:unnamed protein product [Digitaria exilis]